MTCHNCGNVPILPNFINTYEDGDGDEYHVCQMCEDFERDYHAATPEEQERLATVGYEEWQRKWYQEEEEARKP